MNVLAAIELQSYDGAKIEVLTACDWLDSYRMLRESSDKEVVAICSERSSLKSDSRLLLIVVHHFLTTSTQTIVQLVVTMASTPNASILF